MNRLRLDQGYVTDTAESAYLSLLFVRGEEPSLNSEIRTWHRAQPLNDLPPSRQSYRQERLTREDLANIRMGLRIESLTRIFGGSHHRTVNSFSDIHIDGVIRDFARRTNQPNGYSILVQRIRELIPEPYKSQFLIDIEKAKQRLSRSRGLQDSPTTGSPNRNRQRLTNRTPTTNQPPQPETNQRGMLREIARQYNWTVIFMNSFRTGFRPELPPNRLSAILNDIDQNEAQFMSGIAAGIPQGIEQSVEDFVSALAYLATEFPEQAAEIIIPEIIEYNRNKEQYKANIMRGIREFMTFVQSPRMEHLIRDLGLQIGRDYGTEITNQFDEFSRQTTFSKGEEVGKLLGAIILEILINLIASIVTALTGGVGGVAAFVGRVATTSLRIAGEVLEFAVTALNRGRAFIQKASGLAYRIIQFSKRLLSQIPAFRRFLRYLGPPENPTSSNLTVAVPPTSSTPPILGRTLPDGRPLPPPERVNSHYRTPNGLAREQPFSQEAYDLITRDENDRIRTLTGTISPEHLRTGTRTTQAARNSAQRNGEYDAGHLRARLLGGRGGLDNTFPQWPEINQKLFNQFESRLERLIREESVTISVQLRYLPNNSTNVPDFVVYKVRIRGNPTVSAVFDNQYIVGSGIQWI